MASVLNRTTFLILESVNTPDYSEDDWIINPDLSLLDEVPSRHWKIEQNQVLEMNQQEKDAVDVTFLAQRKLEQINKLVIDTRSYVHNKYAPERQQTLSVLLAEAWHISYLIETPVFAGSGLNDISTGGDWEAYYNLPQFIVKIDGVSNPNTISITKNETLISSGVPITGSLQDIGEGIKVNFGAVDGHTLDDNWLIKVKRVTKTNRGNYIAQTLVWVLSILEYHYQKYAEISAASTLTELDAITYNFASFDGTDPLVTIAGALAIQD